MGPVKSLYFSGVSSFGAGWLKKKSPLDVIIPFHHLVSDEPVPYIESLYSFKNTRQFGEDLDWLLKNFKPVSLSELIAHGNGQNPFPDSKGRFLLTFDDGLRQVYDIVAPLLLRKGVPAALFVNPSFVDNKELFYDLKKGLILDKLRSASFRQHSSLSRSHLLREAGKLFGRRIESEKGLESAVRNINYPERGLTDSLGSLFELDFETFRKENKPFMTQAEIKDLSSKGFSIGAHSIDHPRYALVSHEEQLRQTLESVDWVERAFAPAHRTFAFPHTDTGVTHSFFQQLVGTALDTTGRSIDLIMGNSTGMMEQHPHVYHRFIGENPAVPAEKMIKAVLAYSALRRSLGKSYVKRRP